jgi:phosphatidate cytidylyltransferase
VSEKNVLRARVLTAVILLPLLIAAIFWLPLLYFALILGALVLVGAWEWSALVGLTTVSMRVLYVILIALGLFIAAFINITWILSVAALCWLWILAGIIHYQRNGSGAGFQFSVARFLVGFPVLIATWVSIMALKSHPDFGPPVVLLVLCIIFAADTGAYFAGRFLGKRFLCSRVSPKKTGEGFFGGLILSLGVAAVGGYYFALLPQQYVYFMLIAIATILFSIVGDLGVSLLKRITGVKDSGHFFPGHGGMLDRLDSVAAAMVFFVLLALWAGL